MAKTKVISRREFIKVVGIGLSSTALAACQPIRIEIRNFAAATQTLDSILNPDPTSTAPPPAAQPTPTFSPEQLPQLLNEEEKVFLSAHEIREGDTSRPVVMMTYDDNAKYDQVRTILDAFGRYPHAKATFFFIGEKIPLSTKAVHAVVEDGHLLACHGWEHINYKKLTDDQIKRAIERCFQAVQEVVPGYRLRYIRFPFGEGNGDPRMLQIVAEWGLQHVYWTMGSGGLDANTCDNVMRNVENGSIVLSHMFRPYDVSQAQRIVDALVEKGYSLETVDSGKKPEDAYTSLDKAVE